MSAARQVITEIKSYHPFVKLLTVLVVAGVTAAATRFIFGLGITTNLNDIYPWGLWISFDVVTSVPLAAGAFVLGAIVHVFHIKKLEPLVRPAIVTGFLGYSLVCIGLFLDLGQPHKAWHVFVYPNFHSPMFEVSICVMSYTTVAFLEFLAPVCERFGYRVPLRLLRTMEVVAGVIIPMLLFFRKRVRIDSTLQLRAAGLVVFGLVLNRFNVSMFAMVQKNQEIYYLSFLESAVTVGIIAAHLLFFVLIARYSPIFEHHQEEVDDSLPDHFGEAALIKGSH